MINAVIIEDDPLLGKHLAMMIEENCPEIKILALISSGKMALDIIPVLNYDLIFSDIQLGDMDAFSLFEQLPINQKQIIFITAHDEYALHAFKLDATDYLLKPIQAEELVHAVNKAIDNLAKEHLSTLSESFTVQKSGKILIKSNDELHFLLPERIIYCEADGAYSKVYLSGNINEFKVVTMHLKKLGEYFRRKTFLEFTTGILSILIL